MRKPPSSGPSASASAETPAHVPIARPRSAGGKVFVMIESVAGIISAAPTPWVIRLITSAVVEGARPAVAEEIAKRTTPSRNIRRRPRMSPSRPPVASSTANESV